MISLLFDLIGYHMVPGPKELPDPWPRTLADPLSFNWSRGLDGLSKVYGLRWSW